MNRRRTDTHLQDALQELRSCLHWRNSARSKLADSDLAKHLNKETQEADFNNVETLCKAINEGKRTLRVFK